MAGDSVSDRIVVETLKRNKEFGFVYRKGNGTGTKLLVCICAKSRIKGIRVGFVVSSKVGNAVLRNLVRRRLKEIFRFFLPRLEGDYSIVFVARPGIDLRSFKDLSGDMKYLLKKQGLLKVNGK